jgi:hypothetical protein
MKAFTLALVVGAFALQAPLARAQDTHQASQHFQRGVALYGEADYHAALVEFHRAYAIAPNPAVLYNIGETEYQLLDYAAALTSFERFLTEVSPGDARRGEVEGDLEVLRARVGHVSITTTPAGADVTVDDQPAGRTPLEHPLLVSIGHHRIVAAVPGRQAVTRYVDVAADDALSVAIPMPEPAPPPTRSEVSLAPVQGRTTSHGDGTLRLIGWIGTGALTAAAVGFGVLAMRESHELESERGTFPASADVLSHDASLTTAYSIAADGLAAGALAVGVATLLSTFLSRPASPLAGGTSRGGVQLVLCPASGRLVLNF